MSYIKFKLNNKQYEFNGFNVEANFDGEMLSINGDKNDYQFAIEMPSNNVGKYTKHNENASITFDMPDGNSLSAYYEDGNDESKFTLELSGAGNIIEGNFTALLSGEETLEEISEGSFNLNVIQDD